MRVAILGAGPAGLIAALAAEDLGHQVTIYSRKEPSRMYGAMFLHAPVPGISPTDHELEIDVVKVGAREGYAMNVYGDPEAPVSWDRFYDGTLVGWRLPEAYHALWKRYEDRINPREINRVSLPNIQSEHHYTFSTVPANATCAVRDHQFEAQRICVVHGPQSSTNDHPNLMYYNGYTPDGLMDMIGFEWYRYSLINRYESWEYRDGQVPWHVEQGAVPPNHSISYGVKPLRTDCDCHPEVVRLGRFGKWDKNVFVHHSYEAVVDALQ